MGLGGKRHASAALPPVPIVSGPQNQSGKVRNISPPPGFDPRTVQPVASRYTDWAIPAPDKSWVRGFRPVTRHTWITCFLYAFK